MKKLTKLILICISMFSLISIYGADVNGELKKWHEVSVDFTGPMLSEAPSTFRNFRLDVTFTNGANTYVVPGFWAADGDAANTGATEGTIWRAYFAPDAVGQWTYTASFRQGTDVAISMDPNAGTSAGYFDGETDTFNIAGLDGTETGFYAKGMMKYVDKHHLQFAETGEYFLKGGPDSPENFLGYGQIDNTDNNHHYNLHLQHWREGDPTWKNGLGKEIIGSINYLADQGMTSIYMIINTLYGDAWDTYPWLQKNGEINNLSTYDVSKLDQWNIVFGHMDARGLSQYMVLSETENEQMFEYFEGIGQGINQFADTRKLHHREMIARFSHHLGIIWNLGEENGWDAGPVWGNPGTSKEQQKAYCAHIVALDPYDHPAGPHTIQNDQTYYDELYGDPNISFAGLQGFAGGTRDWTIDIINNSAAAGHPLIVVFDEIHGPPLSEDLTNFDELRRDALWIDNLMAGGSGVEWMWHYAELTAMQDFIFMEDIWRGTRIALEFFQQYLPFWNMAAADNLVTGADNYCLAEAGQKYVVYLRNGGTTTVDLSGVTGTFDVYWYDPRNGGDLQSGSITEVNGGSVVSVGDAPNTPGSDWVVVLSDSYLGAQANFAANSTTLSVTEQVTFNATGGEEVTSWSWDFGDGANPATAAGIGPHTITYSTPGYKSVSLTVDGANGQETILKENYLRIFGGYLELAYIDVTPSSASVLELESVQFAAAGRDSAGNAVSVTPVWSVSGGGTISANGLFTGETLGGPYIVSATSDNKTGTATVNVVEPIDTVLFDDFNRINNALLGTPLVGNIWQETEAGGNTVVIQNNAAYLTSGDGVNSPLFKSAFDSDITNGTLTWEFGFDWALTGGEGTYEVRMQMGQSGLQDNDNVTGVAVDLIWGGPNNGLTGNEYFGYVDNSGAVQSLQQISGLQTIKVIANLDTKQYDIEVGGVSLATNVAFRNPDAIIGLVRFYSNGVNTANFGGRSFDNVLVIREVGAEAPVLTSIEITPQNASVEVSGTISFSSVAKDQFGNIMSGITSNWSVDGGGTIDQYGTFSATTPGTGYTVTAFTGSVVGTANFDVTGIVTEVNNATDQEENLIKFYPNPAQDYVHISWNNSEKLEISLLDITGKIIIEEIIDNDSKLILTNIPVGMYFIRVQNGYEQQTRMLIVE